MINYPFNVADVMPERDDIGCRVIINSIGGLSWPDNRTGRKVIDGWDFLDHKRIGRWERALENVGGIVVKWGPIRLWYNAKGRVLVRDGRYLKKDGKYVLKEQRYITEPYWNVLLDGYNVEMQFIEQELTFV